MGNPLISIIVPVFNVEKYLNRCIDSLCNQTYENIEIVLIDDESTDSSGKMCDEWAEKDKRIKVIHKKNGGSGYARNTGIEAAIGDYVAYADADDYLLENAIEKVVKKIQMTNADICYYGCIDIRNDTQSYGTPPEKCLFIGEETKEYIKEILGPAPDSTRLLFGGVSPWSGMVKRSLLIDQNVRFPSEREYLSEDLLYNVSISRHAKVISVEPSCLYCYCHNDNSSLSSKYWEGRFPAAKKMYNYLLVMLNDMITDKEVHERIYRTFMISLISCIKQDVAYKDQIGNDASRAHLKEYCNDQLVVECMRNYPIYKMPIKQRLLFGAVKYKLITFIEILVKLKLK